MSVEWVRLGDITVQNHDVVAVEPDQTYRTLGVLNRGRGLFQRTPLSGAETQYPKFTRANPGQLVYSKLFGWEGSVAVVPEGLEGFVVSPEFPVFDLGPDVDAAYISHAVAWGGFVEQLALATTGLGQRRQRINVSDFVELQIPLLRIDEQRRIAAHLDSLSGVAKRFASTSALSTAWPIALRDRVIAESGGARVPLGRLLTPRRSEAVRPDRTYRITGVYSFGRGLLDRGSLAGYETKYASMTTLREGDVVYSKLGAFEDAVAVVDETFAGTQVSPEFPVFNVVEEIDPIYLRAALTTTSFAEALIQAATGVGARQKRVSPSAFLSLEIPIPRAGRQQAASRILRAAMTITAQDKRTRELSDALLPAARNEIFSAMR